MNEVIRAAWMGLTVLAIGAHPDDIELGAGAHTVEIMAPLHLPYQTTVVFEPGEAPRELEAVLVPNWAPLTVATSSALAGVGLAVPAVVKSTSAPSKRSKKPISPSASLPVPSSSQTVAVTVWSSPTALVASPGVIVILASMNVFWADPELLPVPSVVRGKTRPPTSTSDVALPIT